MSGDRSRYDQMVTDGAKYLAPQVDLIVLAQASMSRLAPRLAEETGMQVLSSPRLAVEYVKSLLETMD
jgi:Asp/Glu/hydantoin racemase